MQSKVTYEDICDFYAQKCQICRGEKRVLTKGIWTCCICQFTATTKWRFEQFDVYPSSLKYKGWDDFTGNNYEGEIRLTPESLISSKQKAIKYCFGTTDPSVLKDKKKYIKVLDHLVDGQNVIIAGPSGCGKTLLALLIIKEVAYASRLLQQNVDFKYIKSQFLLEAARWDNNKEVDRSLLDQLASVDFLVIDNVDLIMEGGHNTPPDMISMGSLFTHRITARKPTILICSERFWASATNLGQVRVIKRQWSTAFGDLLSKPDNVIINIEKISYAAAY